MNSSGGGGMKRPASEVYPLLDLADPRHAKRQLGDRVQAVTGEPGMFTMVVSELPDAVFTLAVTAEKREREYAFSSVSEPTSGTLPRTSIMCWKTWASMAAA